MKSPTGTLQQLTAESGGASNSFSDAYRIPSVQRVGRSVLLSGQVLTSRTETIEDYLRPRVARLGVIGLGGAFQQGAPARCTEYVRGQKVREWKCRGLWVRNRRSLLAPLKLSLVFANYARQIIRCTYRLGERFDLFIGVSCFSSVVGVWLKKLGRVRRLVYYSIDYYIPPRRLGWNWFMVRAFHWADRYCVRHADLVWHITNRIAEGRRKYGGVPPDRYRFVEAPLSYRASLLRFPPVNEVERWTVGFVGTLSENQGVQLLMEILPRLVERFPAIKIRIVGQGPYADEIKRMAQASGHADRCVFHGFIRDEEEMLNIVSRFAVGVAPWTPDEDNNIIYADPGKPKLYLCLGVPCVVTRGPDVATLIEQTGAGHAITYTPQALEEALASILEDERRWKIYREKAYGLGQQFTTETALQPAWTMVEEVLWGGDSLR